MIKSLKDVLKFEQALKPQTITADTNCAGINLADVNALTFLVSVGTFTFTGTNKIALKIEHSDDDSTYVACTADEIFEGEGASVALTLNDAGQAEKCHAIHYRGYKQYARVVLDVSGTVSVTASVDAVKGYNELNP